MSEQFKHPVFEHDDKVLIITRRQFAGDPRRHFVGRVDRYDGNAIRVRGFVFAFDTHQNKFVKRPSQRTRIFPLDNQLILFVLPSDTEINLVRYEVDDNKELVATDGRTFKLELNEFNVGN